MSGVGMALFIHLKIQTASISEFQWAMGMLRYLVRYDYLLGNYVQSPPKESIHLRQSQVLKIEGD